MPPGIACAAKAWCSVPHEMTDLAGARKRNDMELGGGAHRITHHRALSPGSGERNGLFGATCDPTEPQNGP